MPQKYPTLFKRPDSRWWWYSWYTDGGNIRRSCKKMGLSVAEYPKEKALELLVHHLDMGQKPPEPGEESLAWFRNEMLKQTERERLRDTSIKEYRSAFSHLIKLFGSDFKIADIKRIHVNQYQGYILDKGISAATVNKYCSTLRAAYNRLIEQEIITLNPFRTKKLAVIPRGPKHLNREQICRLLAAADKSGNEAGRRLLRISLLTGIRRTEVLYILREDIDLENNRVKVMNSKRRERIKRWIKIPKAARDHFKWFFENDHGYKDGETDMPLRICRPDLYSKWVKKWMQEANLPKSLHLHSLRHTFITLAGESGIELWRLQKHVDHSTSKTTELYFHPDADFGDSIDIDIE